MPENIHSISDYRWGRAAYLDKNNGLYGYVDCKGNIAIEPKFENAMDFMHHMGKHLAVVKYSLKEQEKLTKDTTRIDITGDKVDMGITIFRNLVTIDINGNFTPDIQKIYDEEIKRYNDKVFKEENARKNRETFNYSYVDDADNIMNALEGGYGDIYGF